jgi:hypothetical protein
MKIQIKQMVVTEEKEIPTPAFFKHYGLFCKITEENLIKVAQDSMLIYRKNETAFKTEVLGIIKGDPATEEEFNKVFERFMETANIAVGEELV